MAIDSITIRLTDGIKGAVDYAPNKTYDITAVVSNPDQTAVDAATSLIISTGERFLGRTPVATALKSAPATRKAAASAPKVDPASPVSEPGTEAEAGTLDTGGATSSDPADMGNQPAEKSDPAVVEDWAQAQQITDQELTAHTIRRNAELGDPAKVRALIQAFKPLGEPATRVWTLTEIPQERRADYIARLKALT